MYRSLLAALSLAALPLAAGAAPHSAPDPNGDFSIVNGSVTSADEWPRCVALTSDHNKAVLEILKELGVEDINKFVSDFNYAKKIIQQLNGTTEPIPDSAVREAQAEARKALKGELPPQHDCGGSLINEHWVLTAAHCVSEDDFTTMRIRVPGSTHRPEQFLSVAEVKVHPRYKEEESIFPPSDAKSETLDPASWDVALVRLEKPLANVPHMKLAGVADALPRSGNGIVAGAGGVTWNPEKKGFDLDPKGQLRQAVVPIQDVSVCEDGKEAMLCAEKPSRDVKKPSPASCYGDSGGPLVVAMPDGTKVQYGIVSHTAQVPWLEDLDGRDCGQAPGRYTAVSVVAPWIQSTIGNRVPLVDGIADNKIDAHARKVVHPIPAGDFDATEFGIHLSRIRSMIRPEATRQITGVVLANKDVPADALAGGVLQDNQILMLTDSKDLDRRTLAEIQRLGVKQVTILGGEKAISHLVEARLLSNGFEVNRIFGASRLETAQAIAKSRVHSHPNITSAFISRAYGTAGVSGSETADALALGATAAREHTPILLSPTNEVPKPILDWLKFSSGYKQGVVIGGPQAVSPAVQTALTSQGGMNKVDRLSGEDRVKTAAALASRVKDPSRVVVVDAKNANTWKAAFQVAGIAADLQAPVVLADGNELPKATQDYLSTVKAAKEGPALVCVAQAGACAAAEKALGL